MKLTPAGHLRRPGTKIDRLLSLKAGELMLVPYADRAVWRVTATNAYDWYNARYSTRREGDNLLIYRVS